MKNIEVGIRNTDVGTQSIRVGTRIIKTVMHFSSTGIPKIESQIQNIDVGHYIGLIVEKIFLLFRSDPEGRKQKYLEINLKSWKKTMNNFDM